GSAPGSVSAGLEGTLREAVGVALDRVVGLVVRARDGAEGDEERREVLDGRVGVRHPGGLLAEGEERVDVAAIERLGRPVSEFDRPLRRARLAEEVLV